MARNGACGQLQRFLKAEMLHAKLCKCIPEALHKLCISIGGALHLYCSSSPSAMQVSFFADASRKPALTYPSCRTQKCWPVNNNLTQYSSLCVCASTGKMVFALDLLLHVEAGLSRIWSRLEFLPVFCYSRLIFSRPSFLNHRCPGFSGSAVEPIYMLSASGFSPHQSYPFFCCLCVANPVLVVRSCLTPVCDVWQFIFATPYPRWHSLHFLDTPLNGSQNGVFATPYKYQNFDRS